MSKETQSSNRKVLLINPPFQFRFMGWMGGLAIGVVMVMQVAHAWFFHNLRNQAQMAGLPPDHVFYQFVQDRQVEMNIITAVTFVLVVLLVGVVGLVLSHKIAGPMYRLKKHFESTARTGARPVKFREGDFFQEVPDAYNQQFSKTSQEPIKKAV